MVNYRLKNSVFGQTLVTYLLGFITYVKLYVNQNSAIKIFMDWMWGFYGGWLRVSPVWVVHEGVEWGEDTRWCCQSWVRMAFVTQKDWFLVFWTRKFIASDATNYNLAIPIGGRQWVTLLSSGVRLALLYYYGNDDYSHFCLLLQNFMSRQLLTPFIIIQ